MSALARVEDALREHGCRREGTDWQCPAHEDRSPSLSVAKGDGCVLIHCHAGCATADVLEALGLSAADLFDEPRQNGASKIEDVYRYVDEDGRLLFEVVRFEPKDFRQRRPDPGSPGGVSWSTKGVRRVIYRLPQVLEAVKQGRTIWVVDGEKDVHALERVGEVATCNPGGAKKWRAEYAEAFRDADVVIVPDRDEPGREHAAQVRASLEGLARSVRVVEAKAGKDAADHLGAGLGVDAFMDLHQASDLPRAFVTLDDVEERHIEWRWEKRLPCVGVVVLGGDGGVGKSTLVQCISKSVTRGQALPFGGSDGPARGVVILTAEEDTAAVIRPRMRLMGVDLERVKVLNVDSDEGDAFTLPSGLGKLEEACKEIDAALVVIDTGPAFIDPGLKSNNEEDIRRMLRPLRGLAERLGLLVVVLAHFNKGNGSAGQRIMGGAAWRNAPRLLLMVGVADQKHPSETSERMLVVEKTNLGKYPPAVGFTLVAFHEHADLADIHWGDEHQGVTAQDLVTAAPDVDERNASEWARDWLDAELPPGTTRDAGELLKAAEKQGIKQHTLRRASKALRVHPSKAGMEGGWTWSRPDAEAKMPSPRDVSSSEPEPPENRMATEGDTKVTTSSSGIFDGVADLGLFSPEGDERKGSRTFGEPRREDVRPGPLAEVPGGAPGEAAPVALALDGLRQQIIQIFDATEEVLASDVRPERDP